MSTERADAVLTFSPWDTWRDARLREFCRPPDQAYKSLAASDRVDHLLVADPWRSRPIDWIRRLEGRRADFPSTGLLSHVRPLGWRRQEPASVLAVRRRYEAYDRVLRRTVAARGLRTPAVVTFNPFVAAFAPMEWSRSVVYYGRDDWTAFARNSALLGVLESARDVMQAKGVTICAVSRELADRVAGRGMGFVIPNGIDETTWLTHREAPAKVRALPRPLGAYAGTVDDRLDVDALCSLVQSGVLASIAIFGPVANAAVARRLADQPGIHLLGNLNQQELVGALMSADVCLLIHSVTTLTRAMSPLKLYEYLASGSPVVATDLAPVRDVDGRVILVGAALQDGGRDSRAAYVTPVRTALENGRMTEQERLAFVHDNSWSRRHSVLLDLMFGPSTEMSPRPT
jgi:teichuronic acid biosynthesis glycosyltransferase TuaH